LTFPSSMMKENRNSRIGFWEFQVVPRNLLYAYKIAEKGRCCWHLSRDERFNPNVFREPLSDWETTWDHPRDSDRAAQKMPRLGYEVVIHQSQEDEKCQGAREKVAGRKGAGLRPGLLRHVGSAMRHAYCMSFQLTSWSGVTAICITIVKNTTFKRAPKNASDPFHDLPPIKYLALITLEWKLCSLN
jgi:hypothetical protein